MTLRDFVEQWLPLIQVLGIPIVGLCWRAFQRLRADTLAGIEQIRAELQRMNSKIVSLEQWRSDHVEACDERNHRHSGEISGLRARVDALYGEARR